MYDGGLVLKKSFAPLECLYSFRVLSFCFTYIHFILASNRKALLKKKKKGTSEQQKRAEALVHLKSTTVLERPCAQYRLPPNS